ncbi:alpha/beta fold hydrolase [Rhodococcus sp. D2-41]|uniref:Alpha/beta fold hydrolase n=1 Tax=Speluncibacter jeojiensis TaxID=2710754 RepID=A0A9X4M1Z5_9ACTN|nr:alpha/beta fold hydrolase [Rhodococcus sp. D2-41]MDG3008906.1 alpha/beta fold hydrolase [Rhodococcus sp. D2-41]MDG3016528.1 alpha/beta fold hydrolase [Corynebacteriales bacterium D3-21]
MTAQPYSHHDASPVGDARPAVSPARRRTVRNGAFDLAVFEEGNPDGPTLVLVHGWPDTHHLWDHVVPLLADRFRIVRYDTRGHGESTVPERVEDFRLEAMAADLFAVLDAVSPDEPAHLLAHDWGSVQVWEAVCEPGAERRVASFTSISGPNLDHLGKWMRRRLARPTPRNVWQPVSQLISSAYTFFFMAPLLPTLFFRGLGGKTNWALFLRAVEGIRPDQVAFADSLRADMISGLRIYRANVVQRVLRPRDRYTSVPVQLLVNRRDIAVRPAGYDDTDRWTSEPVLRKDLPTGHWLPFSSPELIAEHTVAFVDSLDRDADPVA